MTKYKFYTFLCLLLCVLTVRASALMYTGETRTHTAEIGTPAALTAPYTRRASADADAAFYGYLSSLGRRKAPEVEQYASVSAGKHLQGFDRKLYDILKEDVIKVAAGNRESTIFRFTTDDLGLTGRSWTAAELGVTVAKDASGQLTDATWDAVWEPLYRAIGHDRQKSSSAIMDKLLVDCPYELYWFAKSYDGADNAAAHWTYHWSVKYSENKGFTFSNDAYLDIEMMVAENYAKSADSNSYYNYRIDTSLAKQAASIAANARKVVDANKSRSDFEKLTAYRDAICDAVSYDHAAAQQGSGAYGNGPWQLIRVFDGDTSTNVVCEGYAKAFQYLCDLSTFSGDVCSYIITGDLVDRNGKPGPHMWNHVRINGRYWLVDLTNCDVEGVSRDWLFFKAPYAQTVQGGKRSYAFARNGEVALRYTNLENAYEAEEILILTEVDYSSLDSNAADNGNTPAQDSGNTPAPDGGNTPAPDGGNTAPNNDNGDTPAPVPDTDTGNTPDSGGGISPENADWSVTYPVMVTAGSSNFAEAPAGVAVSVTADPAPAGQRFLTWGGAAGLTFTRGSVSSASATFLMPSGPLYLSAVYEEARFDDVEPGAYYDQPVLWAITRGITNGVSPTSFAPHETCTRAQILTFLYRAAGQPPIRSGNPFPDVSPEVYYYRPAIWAAERGLVDGELFEPNTPCTRAAVMVYFWKLAGAPTGNRNPFEDVPDWMDYAEAIAWGVSRGITAGTTPTTFEPERTCTRAQIVTFLYRHLVETGGSLNAAGWQEPEPETVPAPDDSGETTPPDSGDSADIETL
ncbi:MAG: S-layer homology domain-containing protein [Oscillibacter sp.]|nr:S-layer homology domain-containing protein [Oscillibacter sp.]